VRSRSGSRSRWPSRCVWLAGGSRAAAAAACDWLLLLLPPTSLADALTPSPHSSLTRTHRMRGRIRSSWA
jgi:hypothetical protein